MIFIPFVLPLMAIAIALVLFSPVLAVLTGAATVHSAILVFLPARLLTRTTRTRTRVLGYLLLVIGSIATVAFAGLAVLFTLFAITYGWPNSV